MVNNIQIETVLEGKRFVTYLRVNGVHVADTWSIKKDLSVTRLMNSLKYILPDWLK